MAANTTNRTIGVAEDATSVVSIVIRYRGLSRMAVTGTPGLVVVVSFRWVVVVVVVATAPLLGCDAVSFFISTPPPWVTLKSKPLAVNMVTNALSERNT
jgi:hypothetical protein